MEYVPASDIKDTCEELVARYPVLLEKVNMERIACFRELEQESGPRIAYLEKTRELDKQLNPNFDYKLVVHDKKTSWLNPAQFHILLLKCLMGVGGVETDTKGREKTILRPFSVMDFYEIVATFGPDWIHDDTVRDPLSDTIDFPPPLSADKNSETQEVQDLNNPEFV